MFIDEENCMIIEKAYNLDANSFRKYDNANIEQFVLNKNGVILKYTKDGQSLSLGARTLDDAIKQWNGGLI